MYTGNGKRKGFKQGEIKGFTRNVLGKMFNSEHIILIHELIQAYVLKAQQKEIHLNIYIRCLKA